MKSGVFLLLPVILFAGCAPQRPAAHQRASAVAPETLAAEKPGTPQQQASLEQRLIQNALDLKNQGQLNYKIQPGDLIEVTDRKSVV